MSTTSNEACKLFDAAIGQYVNWREDGTLGGLGGTLQKLNEADPNFVMGKVLTHGMSILGTGSTTRLDSTLKKGIEDMILLAQSTPNTTREQQHVEAVKLWADGHMSGAAKVWENILVDHPTDMLALKFAHDTYFYSGQGIQIRDSVARVFSSWKPEIPYYENLYGMLAFGLEETRLYDKAKEMATKGLELKRDDAWATHALAHVYEMTGQQQIGIDFLEKTNENWAPSRLLACHNYWHWALFAIEQGQYEVALTIYDKYLAPRITADNFLDIVDNTALLFRLQMEGVDVGNRWTRVNECCSPHSQDHILVFNDVHLLMSYLGSSDNKSTELLMGSLYEFVESCGATDQGKIFKSIGIDLFKAFIEYNSENYGAAVKILNSIRYKIVTIGGSDAQRDIFNLLLINAALKSTETEHRKLARALLAERKMLKENAPMTDRLMARFTALHGSDS